MDFLKLYQHLLPDGRAWRTTVNKRLRQFFSGLTVIPEDVKQSADSVWADLLPESTDKLTDWERQFGLPSNVVNEADRRSRLAATWRALIGGQSPRYIQDTLRAAGFDVYVYEWWQDGTDPTPGAPGAPVPRDPDLIIRGSSAINKYLNTAGNPAVTCGNPAATAGAFYVRRGYWLKNPTYTDGRRYINTAGNPSVTCGNPAATAGAFDEYRPQLDFVPTPTGGRQYMLYICGAGGFTSTATVDRKRKEELEELLMQICPAQQWVGVNVIYT